MARKGFTLIELMIVIAIIAVLAGIAIPSLLESRMAASETKAIGALKAVGISENIFRRRKGFYAGGPTFFADLQNVSSLDAGIADNAADYSGFALKSEFPGNSTSERWQFGISASPVVWAESGKFHYYSNHTSGIWQSDVEADSALIPKDGSNLSTDGSTGSWFVLGG